MSVRNKIVASGVVIAALFAADQAGIMPGGGKVLSFPDGGRDRERGATVTVWWEPASLPGFWHYHIGTASPGAVALGPQARDKPPRSPQVRTGTVRFGDHISSNIAWVAGDGRDVASYVEISHCEIRIDGKIKNEGQDDCFWTVS